MLKLLLKFIFKTLKVLSTVLVIIALIVVISQRMTKNKLRLFGYGVYTVISESMLPEYEIGDMFLAKEVAEDDIKLGDDIVYIGEEDSYKDKIITHRVIRIEDDKTIVTKGINNDLEDPPIQYKQVYGKVSARLLALSIFSKLMNNNNNVLFYLLIFVPFTILIFLDTKDLFNEKNKKGKKGKEESSVTVETTPVLETTAQQVISTAATTMPVTQPVAPTVVPTVAPTAAQMVVPTVAPTMAPTVVPTIPVVEDNKVVQNVPIENKEVVEVSQENKE